MSTKMQAVLAAPVLGEEIHEIWQLATIFVTNTTHSKQAALLSKREDRNAGRFEYCKQEETPQNDMLLSTIATHRGDKVDDTQSSFVNI